MSKPWCRKVLRLTDFNGIWVCIYFLPSSRSTFFSIRLLNSCVGVKSRKHIYSHSQNLFNQFLSFTSQGPCLGLRDFRSALARLLTSLTFKAAWALSCGKVLCCVSVVLGDRERNQWLENKESVNSFLCLLIRLILQMLKEPHTRRKSELELHSLEDRRILAMCLNTM